jgi:hypothetical protein
MPLPKPHAQRTFSAPEIWLILQALGAVPAQAQASPEITTDPNALEAARGGLLRAGLLQAGAEGRLIATPGIEALVGPAAYPQAVIVVNVADSAQHGKTARLACVSWTPGATVVNWVDQAATHHFRSYSPWDTAACLWGYLTEWCALDVGQPDPAQPQLRPEAMEREIRQVRQTVLLMATRGLRTAGQDTRALSWLVSGQRAWLLQKNGQAGKSAPQPAGPAELQQAVSALAGWAVAGP